MRKHQDNSNAFCDSVTAYMASLLNKRDFVGAIQYYEVNRSLVNTVSRSRSSDLLHQVAKAYASVDDYQAALRAARLAQAAVADDGDSLRLAEIFTTLGGVLRDSGELMEAQRVFRDAESIFRRNDCLEGQCRALNQLAGLFFRQTDYRNALTILMDAVAIANKLDDRQKLAYMMGNVGRLHTFMGNFSEAEKHLQINIELSTELGDELEIARARLSLGYVYLQTARYEATEKELEQAYPLIVALNARREEVMYLTYLGELQYRTSQYEQARDTLERGLTMAEGIASGTSLAARVMRHLAELHLRLNNMRLATRSAARAMAIMEKTDNKVEIGALTKIKAQIAAANGNAGEARELFTRALDLLEQSRVRFEKAEALVAAGSVDCFERRQRLSYLFRAEEFYAGNRIHGKLQQVSKLLAELGDLRPVGRSGSCPVATSDRVDFITRSLEIERFKEHLSNLRNTDLPILITGETGVGKDHFARYIHSQVRLGSPYVAINCASVPETLLESELFGYRRGAFTGADRDKKGLFAMADGGILLLDEIGDMPLVLQAKLLGVLEQRKVIPLGSTCEVSIDVVLVAATNQDLEQMVEEGRFRRDLYYRLSGITFRLPPLRERKEDIPVLLEHFLAERNMLGKQERLPSELARLFIDYDWPGNVRELLNKVKRLELMAELTTEGDLTEVAASVFGQERSAYSPSSLFERVEQFERQLISEALLAARGNKSETARMLGIHEATVRTKLKRYGITLEGISLEGGAPS